MVAWRCPPDALLAARTLHSEPQPQPSSLPPIPPDKESVSTPTLPHSSGGFASSAAAGPGATGQPASAGASRVVGETASATADADAASRVPTKSQSVASLPALTPHGLTAPFGQASTTPTAPVAAVATATAADVSLSGIAADGACTHPPAHPTGGAARSFAATFPLARSLAAMGSFTVSGGGASGSLDSNVAAAAAGGSGDGGSAAVGGSLCGQVPARPSSVVMGTSCNGPGACSGATSGDSSGVRVVDEQLWNNPLLKVRRRSPDQGVMAGRGGRPGRRVLAHIGGGVCGTCLGPGAGFGTSRSVR